MHRPKRLSSSFTGQRHSGQRRRLPPLVSILFFPAAILYHELLLRLFDSGSAFFSLALLRILLFSVAAGLLIFLILDLLPWRTAARIAGGVLLGLGTALFCIERGCRNMFGLYWGISVVGGMAGEVTGEFGSTVWSAIVSIIPFILLSLVPVVVYVVFRQDLIARRGQENLVRLVLAGVMVVCQLIAFLLSAFGGAKSDYTYDFTANTAIPQFGLITSVRVELEYAVFGTPEVPLEVFVPEETQPGTPSADPNPSADPSDEPSATPVVYGYNTMDIDFEALAESAGSDTIKTMCQYFGSLTPSQQNEYTGMFEGKNLILITAEAFSTAAIDKELTPTLYKLANSGFVFNNFYQPDWTQSTVGGEFAVTTGIIPNWINGGWAAGASIDNDMPLTLAHQFAALGYSVPAWHNHTYTYYKRDQYLTNFGYDYKGVGNGLELPSNLWPNSDLEMMEATVDSYIDGYVNNGTNFHAYYMTVSGHGYYSWAGNAMSRKHRAEVEAKYPNLSEPSQAYLACNMELDLALEYLIDKLEAAGIADDTLIVMAGDHYPYLLTQDQSEDYYNELRGVTDSELVTSRYHSTLIMWSGCIEEPIVVDTPCSSIDIVPTISNLFGLEYDSRLYSGRDIFATNYEVDKASTCMPLVVFANNKGQGNSWITAAGTYEASTGVFTPNEGVTVDDDYVNTVKRLVSNKIQYAKLILTEDYYRVVFGE